MLHVTWGWERERQYNRAQLWWKFHGIHTTNTATCSLTVNVCNAEAGTYTKNMQYVNLVDINVQITKGDLSKDQ